MADTTAPPTEDPTDKTTKSDSLLEDILGSTYDSLHKIFIKKTELNFLERWTARRAGGDVDILSISPPSEKNKYLAMGGSVIANTLLAFLSSFYFFFSFANNKTFDQFTFFGVSAIASTVVSFIIYNIEFSIVSSKNITTPVVLSRILLSMFIGYVFSQPIEALVFRKSIMELVQHEKRENKTAVGNKYTKDINDKRGQLKDLEDSLEPQRKTLSVRSNTKIGNCDVRKPSYDKYRCEEFTSMYKESKKSYDLSVQIQQSLITEIANLTKESALDITEVEKFSSDDVLKQLEALDKIASNSFSAWAFRTAITFLLILFDTLPVIIKITSSKSNYEKVLDFQDELKERERTEIRSFYDKVIQSEYKNKLFFKEITHRTATAKKLTEDSVRKSTELLEQTEVFASKVVEKLDEAEKLKPEKLKEAHKKRIEKVYDDFFVIFDSTWDKFMTFIKTKPFT